MTGSTTLPVAVGLMLAAVACQLVSTSPMQRRQEWKYKNGPTAFKLDAPKSSVAGKRTAAAAGETSVGEILRRSLMMETVLKRNNADESSDVGGDGTVEPPAEWNKTKTSSICFSIESSDVGGDGTCDLSAGERLDCGTFGMEEDGCLERGCCWRETNELDVPWCYHSTQSLTSECSAVEEDARIECGNYGARQDDCSQLGCCWRPTESPNVPWCYHARAPAVVDGGQAGSVDENPAPTCGSPAIAPNVNLRVVGGTEATKNSWPWMASLQSDGRHFCGGSLINDQWIMSAAHCKPGFDYLVSKTVVLGLHSRSNPDSHSLRVKVAEIVPSEKYGRNPDKMSNDVMLLKLEHPVNFTDAISPICLPTPFKKIPAGRRCYSTGWGTLSSGGESPDVLMQVQLPVIDNDVCNRQNWYDGRIDDTMVCAGFEEGGYDTCQGDSGGPFVCYDDDRWILYGVVSWGFGCADAQHPGLYGRTSPYLKWLNKKLNEYA